MNDDTVDPRSQWRGPRCKDCNSAITPAEHLSYGRCIHCERVVVRAAAVTAPQPQPAKPQCRTCRKAISEHQFLMVGVCGQCETLLKKAKVAPTAFEDDASPDRCGCGDPGASPPCLFCENSFECERCHEFKHNSKMECDYHPEIVCIYCAEQEREYGGDVASTPAADVGCKPESNLTDEEKKVDKDKLMESIRNACRGR